MILIVIVIVLVLIIVLYNHLVAMKIRCDNAYSQIDNQLKRRADLIPNLVNVTKGYAKYESEVLMQVVEKRNVFNNIEQIAKNSKEISDKLLNLLAISESYPDLKANQVFLNLQVELTGTEDKIAYARQFYNDSVQKYNTSIMKFPNNILAKILKYQEKPYFQVSEEDKKEVEVKL